ncbi:ABC transporter ATP-binding protein [Ilumatobacter fluminis]|uniref:ABC transporter ATP-binding protein n=1 Tax=Ilumatobacter fluminis TaxID=467091 RepID=UPI0032EE5EBA
MLLAVRVALGIAAPEQQEVTVPLLGFDLAPGVAVAIAGVCAVFALLAHTAVAWLSATLGAYVLRTTREQAVESFVGASWSTQSRQSEGALQDAVATLCVRVSQLVQALTNGLSHVITLTAFVVAAAIVDPVSTSVVIIAGLCVIALLRPMARTTQRRSSAFVAANGEYNESVARFTTAAMELKLFGVQRVREEQLRTEGRAVEAFRRRAQFVNLFGAGLFKDIAVMLLVVAVAVMVVLDLRSLAGVGVVLALVLRALASAQQANSAVHAAAELSPNAFELQARVEKLAGDTERRSHGSEVLPSLERLAFADVSYQYPGTSEATLRGVSVVIGGGEAVGIVGPSGGGKSTFVQLLLRLRSPTDGIVTVNDEPYAAFDPDAWAESVALVPQDAVMFEGTIAENIAFYRDVDLARVVEVARMANVYDEIVALEGGFDHRLGPRGSGLSGGQRQRVALARALAGSPKLLVMDEPSSALDVASEARLADLIGELKGRMTLVVVAHRPATIQSCDRLVGFVRGRAVELGRPSDFELSEESIWALAGGDEQ